MSSRHLLGSRRASKPRNRIKLVNPQQQNDISGGNCLALAAPQRKEHDYRLIPIKEKVPRPKPRGMPSLKPGLRKGAVLAMPFNQTFAQDVALPSEFTGSQAFTQSGSNSMLPVAEDSNPAIKTVYQDHLDCTQPLDDYAITFDVGPVFHLTSGSKQESGRHRRRREQQFTRWREDIIPQLISPLMQLRRETENGRLPPHNPNRPIWYADKACTCGKAPRTISILLAYWDRE
jgi:hypothetical protein